MWVKNIEPDVYRNTAKMVQVKDYLAYKLTGQLVSDYSDASGTNAFGIHDNQWSEKIIEQAGLVLDKFPEL